MNILITGGSRGLGKAIVEAFASKAGNNVFFTYNTSRENAEALESAYPNVKGLQCDFTLSTALDAFLEKIEGMNIDILVNNFHIGYTQDHFHKTPAEDFMLKFQANIYPTIRVTQNVIKTFMKKKYGRIVNVLSSYVKGNPPVGLSGYVAEKQYLLSLSNSWATEYSRYNIASNCVSPSFMETDFNAAIDSRIIDSLRAQQPLKKFITPEDVAPVIEFLCNASMHLSGQNIVLN